MARRIISCPDGYLHEREVLPRLDPDYPFKDAPTPDLYAMRHRRVYTVVRGRYQPKIANRTAYNNALYYGHDFDQSDWSKPNGTTVDGYVANPRDGAETANKVFESATTGPFGVTQSINLSTFVARTVSVCAKPNGRNWILLRVSNGAYEMDSWYNLVTGSTRTVLTTLTPISGSIGNGNMESAFNAGAGNWDHLSSWVGLDSSVGRDATVSHGGSASAKFSLGPTNYAIPTLASHDQVMTVGLQYTLTFWAKGTAANAIHWLNGGTQVVPSLTGSWQQFSYTFTAAGTYLYFVGHAASCDAWLDDVDLQVVSGSAVAPVASSAWCPGPTSGFLRCISNFTLSGTCTIAIYFSSDGTTINHSGSASLGVILWGAQLGDGSLAGPVIDNLDVARSVTAPDLDPEDFFAFLFAESQPEPLGTGDLMRVERTFARIPSEQAETDWQDFARPSAHGLKSGSSYVVSFDDALLDIKSDWTFTSRKTITSVANYPEQTFTASLPSGNITFQDSGGHTSAVAANTAPATMQSTLAAALTSLSNIAVTGGTNWLAVTWTGSMASIMLPSGLRLTSLGGSSASFQSTGNTTIAAALQLYAASHGGVVGDRVALWAGDAFVGVATVGSVVSSDVVSLLSADLAVVDSMLTHCAFSSDAASRIATGVRNCRARNLRTYWLPGFSLIESTGATVADKYSIPLVTSYESPLAWLGRIVAGSTWAAIRSGELAPYLGALQERRVIEVQMASAIETLTP